MLNKSDKILIIGLGLIGGSYALALKQKGYFVGGIDISKKTLDYALENRIIDDGREKIDGEFISRFDVIVFAVYPKLLVPYIEKIQGFIKENAIITDVTGVKGKLVQNVQKKLRRDLEFIGAHPMAGKETGGIENANTEMFKNANYIVTPTKKNTEKAISTATDIGKELGFSKISLLSPKKHDEMIGFLSQLTHCIAVSLMTCRENENLVDYTGDSFRDLTRIAKINEEMWTQLFMENKQELIAQMQKFSDKFNQIKEMIEIGNSEELKKTMKLSTKRRIAFDELKGDK